jgi:hypothetical protein
MWATGWLRSYSGFEARTGRHRRRQAVLQGSIRDSVWEERCLLSAIPMPSNTVFPPGTDGTGLVLYDGVTGQYVKQITITNDSSDETIYPFLEDANSRTAIPGDPSPAPSYAGTRMFDPFDPVNQE